MLHAMHETERTSSLPSWPRGKNLQNQLEKLQSVEGMIPRVNATVPHSQSAFKPCKADGMTFAKVGSVSLRNGSCRESAVHPPEDSNIPIRRSSVEEAMSLEALQAPLSETRGEAAALAGKPRQQEGVGDSVNSHAVPRDQSSAPQPATEPCGEFPEPEESTEPLLPPTNQIMINGSGNVNEGRQAFDQDEHFVPRVSA